jgi:4-hydroxy-3-methylbut-2-en-1-yl diphosphate synthase IspG/GcpE
MLADKEMFQRALVKELRLNAVVLKQCKCGQPATGWQSCPSCGREVVKVDQGLVAYRHKNWWMNVAYKLGFIK